MAENRLPFTLSGRVAGFLSTAYDMTSRGGPKGVSHRVFVMVPTADGLLGSVESCKIDEADVAAVNAAGFGARIDVTGTATARGDKLDKRADAGGVKLTRLSPAAGQAA